MHEIKEDTDLKLAVFVNDYVEGWLDPIEQLVFEECLVSDNDLESLVRKSKAGKKALRNANRVTAADDFEEKLAKRIAGEKEMGRTPQHFPSA